MNHTFVRLRTLFYKAKYQWLLRRAYFGPGVRIACRLEIKGPGRVMLGREVRIDGGPWPGEFVTIFTHSRQARVHVRDRVRLRGTRIGSQHSITIGEDATIEAASVFDTDFHSPVSTERENEDKVMHRPVEIGSGSYVGCECLCGKGSKIGAAAHLVPGAVVSTRVVAPAEMMWGNPPRRIGPSVAATSREAP